MNDNEFIPINLAHLLAYMRAISTVKGMEESMKEATELLQIMAEQDILNKICSN